jgi:hypothetical protein
MWGHGQSSSHALGPEYWLRRCDGFSVVGNDGSRGEVDTIVEDRGVVEGVSVRFGSNLVYVAEARILDIDPVVRVVLVDETARSEGGT